MKTYNKKGFEKAFKNAVTNFDETKIFFEHKGSRIGGDVFILFVWQNKLRKLKMHRSDYSIQQWANHFIDFLNTGEFDYNGYWKLYTSERNSEGDLVRKFVDDKIYKFPLCTFYKEDFHHHSSELQDFYKTEEGKNIGKEHGIQIVPKPIK